jgi:hypothetical protein
MTIPNRTFGVEIEIKGLGTWDATVALRNAGIIVEDCGYTHQTTSYWKVVTDGSLRGTACEVVSPVLSGESGLEAIRTVCRALSSSGARIDRECGLHVHVGTDGMSANDAAMVLARYARFEDTIDAFMPRSRRGNANTYCRPIGGLVSARVQGRTFSRIADVASAMGGDRYVKVNMQAYARHRTIEFRQHSGSCNGNKIEQWVRFVLHFVEASMGQATMVEVSDSPTGGTDNQNNSRRFTHFTRHGRRMPRANSMDAKLDRLILAFRASPAQRLSVGTIASVGRWSRASVPPYITRLRSERGCLIRKIRGTDMYILIGNTGRLSTDAAAPVATVAVETQRAARRVEGVADIANDSVFRGMPEEIISYFEERRSELGN